MNTADVAIKAGAGVVAGAGVDQLLYGLTAYIPQLANAAPFVVPGYAPGGIHYDDLMALAAGGAVAILGAAEKKPENIAMGIGMLAGAYISSQFQRELPKQIGAKFAKVSRFSGEHASLVQVD